MHVIGLFPFFLGLRSDLCSRLRDFACISLEVGLLQIRRLCTEMPGMTIMPGRFGLKESLLAARRLIRDFS